jgi:hypothetical protein
MLHALMSVLAIPGGCSWIDVIKIRLTVLGHAKPGHRSAIHCVALSATALCAASGVGLWHNYCITFDNVRPGRVWGYSMKGIWGLTPHGTEDLTGSRLWRWTGQRDVAGLCELVGEDDEEEWADDIPGSFQEGG